MDDPTSTAGPAPDGKADGSAGVKGGPHGAMTCGPYRLLEVLGRGGMGVVYRAVRLDPDLPQPVALKRLLGRFDERAIARFRRERRVLSRLQHPGIARLYDGGTDEDGMPYLVMELVEGEPLTVAADRHRLSIERRVELFAEVCAAVDAAHRALVVHRDLKPSNILVMEDGHPKLLDFGIARLVDPETAESEPAPTREGPGALTPEYAAPEQIRGETVGTAVDVFALGVVLCELLTGRRPWRGGTDRWRAPDTEPLRATQLLTDADALAVLAKERSTVPAQLRRAIVGDLEAIVGRALELSPEHRYPSPAALRDDLLRWCAGEPVVARRAGALYRARKFLVRHRLPVAGAAAFVLALSAGVVATSWQAKVARREARRTEAVRDFLVGLFEHADPDAERGPALPVGDVLAQGRLRVESELGDDLATRAALEAALQRVYESLGETDRATELGRAARRDFSAAGEAGTPAALEVEVGLVRLDIAREAWADARSGLEALRPSLERPGNAGRAEFLALSAALAVQDGRADEALALQRAALDEARAGGDEAEVRRRLVELSDLLRSTRNIGDGARRLEEARELLENLGRRVPAGSRLGADVLHGLGVTLHQVGRYAEAGPTLEQALEVRTRLLGPNHPDTLSTVSELANDRTYAGDYAGAAVLFDTLVARLEESLGREHSDVAVALNNRALLEYNRNEFVAALEHFERAAAIFEKALGPRHEWTLSALSNAAGTAGDLGQWDSAEERLRDVLARNEAAFGAASNSVAPVLGNLGILRRRRGDPGEALALHQRQVDIYRANLGADHDFTIAAIQQQCWARLDLGDRRSLEEIIDRMTPLLARATDAGAGWAPVANHRMTLGRALLRLDRVGEAAPLLEGALAAREENHSTPHWRRAEIRLAVAGLREKEGRKAEAAELRKRAHEDLVAAVGAKHPLVPYLERTVP